jgi:hypothetical protein
VTYHAVAFCSVTGYYTKILSSIASHHRGTKHAVYYIVLVRCATLPHVHAGQPRARHPCFFMTGRLRQLARSHQACATDFSWGDRNYWHLVAIKPSPADLCGGAMLEERVGRFNQWESWSGLLYTRYSCARKMLNPLISQIEY